MEDHFFISIIQRSQILKIVSKDWSKLNSQFYALMFFSRLLMTSSLFWINELWESSFEHFWILESSEKKTLVNRKSSFVQFRRLSGQFSSGWFTEMGSSFELRKYLSPPVYVQALKFIWTLDNSDSNITIQQSSANSMKYGNTRVLNMYKICSSPQTRLKSIIKEQKVQLPKWFKLLGAQNQMLLSSLGIIKILRKETLVPGQRSALFWTNQFSSYWKYARLVSIKEPRKSWTNKAEVSRTFAASQGYKHPRILPCCFPETFVVLSRRIKLWLLGCHHDGNCNRWD